MAEPEGTVTGLYDLMLCLNHTKCVKVTGLCVALQDMHYFCFLSCGTINQIYETIFE